MIRLADFCNVGTCVICVLIPSCLIFVLGDPDIPHGIDWLLWFHIGTVTVYECYNKVHSPLASQLWLTPTVHLSQIYHILEIFLKIFENSLKKYFLKILTFGETLNLKKFLSFIGRATHGMAGIVVCPWQTSMIGCTLGVLVRMGFRP